MAFVSALPRWFAPSITTGLADELAGDLADTEPDSSTYSFTNALVSR
jgi:hypothetical protein